jgi:hypothetical protein
MTISISNSARFSVDSAFVEPLSSTQLGALTRCLFTTESVLLEINFNCRSVGSDSAEAKCFDVTPTHPRG